MTDFWKEMKQGVECIRLVEQLLREDENLVRHLKERGRPTALVEFRIARMKYALGDISIRPNHKDYFPIKDADSHIKE